MAVRYQHPATLTPRAAWPQPATIRAAHVRGDRRRGCVPTRARPRHSALLTAPHLQSRLRPTRVRPATSTAAEVESNVPPTMGELADLDLLGERIAELSARIQAATYELLCDLREFDRHHGWEGLPLLRPLAQLAHRPRPRRRPREAARRHRPGRPQHLSAAMACGRLSYSVVRALTRVATPDNEASLVAIACCATGAQVERMVRAWRQADEAGAAGRRAGAAGAARPEHAGWMRMAWWYLRARLTPEVGAVVLRAPGGGAGAGAAGCGGRRGGHRAAAGGRAGVGGRERAGRRTRSGQRWRPLPGDDARGSGDPSHQRDRPRRGRHFRGNARTGPGRPGACSPGGGRRFGLDARGACGRSPTALVAPDAAPRPQDRGPVSRRSGGAGADRAPGDLQLAPAVFFLDSGTEPVSPDAGKAVIEQAGGIHVGKEAARRVPAMPGSWCCAAPPTAACSTWDAAPARCRRRCVVPSRSGIAAIVSSPAATPATVTPSCGALGRRRGDEAL